MKKVLAAIDGSEASLRAARLALEVADATGGEVTLVHAFRPAVLPVMPGIVPPAASVDLHEADLAHAAAVLDRAAEALGRPNLARETLLGPTGEVIADYAGAHGFELVTVGSRGYGAVKRVLLGSVADRLVHVCPCPVLVAR